MDGQMLYESIEEIVKDIYPIKSIDGVTISKQVKTTVKHTLSNITKVTVVLCSVDRQFEGDCVSCVFDPKEFPDRVTPGVKMRITETLQQELNRFVAALVKSENSVAMNKTEELIGIFGALCDYMVDNGGCNEFCPYAETKDEDDECEAWRKIQKIRREENEND